MGPELSCHPVIVVMFRVISVLVALAVLICLVSAKTVDLVTLNEHPIPITTTLAPSPSHNVTTTTSEHPNVNTTTAAPLTTPKPITSTHAPNVTTPSPPTPTPPTPSPSTPSPSTPSPSSTTPGPTTPSPISTSTTAKPSDDVWMVTDHGQDCILAKMNITIKFKGNSTEHKEVDWRLDNSMSDVSVSGSCSDTENSLILGKGLTNIIFIFALKNSTAKTYYVSNIDLKLDPSILNRTDHGLINMTYKGEDFLTHVNNSYKCSSPSPFKLNSSLGLDVSEVVLSDVSLEAFRVAQGKTFSSPVNCVSDVPDIVPIVVGVILALLVVITLAGYLIGRKRSHARGYTSM